MQKLLALTPDNIAAFVPASNDIAFAHTVFAQCFFPLRRLRGGKKSYFMKHGRASIAIDAGRLLNPRTGDLALQDVPSGSAARLVMGHIQNYVKRSANLEDAIRVNMGDSLRNFFRQYGKKIGGSDSRAITQQVNNIAAMNMTIGLWTDDKAKQINVPTLAEEIDFWLEKDEWQRTFWQPEMILNRRFAQTIRDHSMPYDMRAMIALYDSPREMDILLWLTYRLPSIRPRSSIFVPFFGPNGLHSVFGSGNASNRRKWKGDFLKSVKNVVRYYPDARVSAEDEGLRLYRSPPSIPENPEDLAKASSLFFCG